ncbi:PAS domain S-box protein [bacterium]|nr:PAS domain S-box protein [bacterium]
MMENNVRLEGGRNDKAFLADLYGTHFMKLRANGTISFVSDEMAKLLCHEPEHLRNLNLFDLIIQVDTSDRVYRLPEDLEAESSILFKEALLRKADGEGVWVAMRIVEQSLLEDEKTYVAICTNIHPYIEDRSQLSEWKKFFKQIVEVNRDPILLFDQQFKIIYISSSIEQLLGVSTNHYYHKHITEIFFPKDRHLIEEAIAKLEQHPEALERFEGRLLTVNNQSRFCRFTVSDQRELEEINGYALYIKDQDSAEKARQLQLMSEQKLQHILSVMPGAIFSMKVSGSGKPIINYVSEGIEGITGYKNDQYMHAELSYFVHPGDWPKFKKKLSECEDAIRTVQMEFRTYHKNGSIVWLGAIATGVLNEKGELEFSGSLQDVTFRKRSQELLEDALHRMKVVSDISNDAIWDWDVVSDECFYGEGYAKLFGYDPCSPEFLAQDWRHRIHPEDLECVNAKFEQAINDTSASIWEATYRYLKVDGSYAHVYGKARILRNFEGMPLRMVGAVSDLSDKKQSDKALEEMNQLLKQQTYELQEANRKLNETKMHYKQMFQISPLPKYIYDVQSLQILDANEAAIRFYGYTAAEFKSMRVSDFTLPCEDNDEVGALRSLASKGFNPQAMHQQITKSGKNVTVEISTVKMKFNEHPAEMVVVKDITSRMEYTRKIDLQNKKLKDIAWTQAHVVRAPLANIMGLVDLLQGSEDAEENKKFIGMIGESAHKLDQAIKDVVMLSTEDKK